MADLVEHARKKIDEQWEHYAHQVRRAPMQALPIAALIVVSAVAGAWVGPVWQGVVSTPAPHLFAIALAMLSMATFVGFFAMFARIQAAAPRPPFIGPSPTSKAAFLLREWSASQRRSAILWGCAFQAYLVACVFVGLQRAQAAPSAIATMIAAIFCFSLVVSGVATAGLVFGMWRQQDEFDAAMRGSAAQVGFWSALTVLGSALIATTFLGSASLPWLPFGFMIMVVVPSLTFVVLTSPSKKDG